MPNEWQSVLDEIKNSVSDMAYNTYFAGKFNFESVDENGLLTITVPSIFIKKQIESKYIDVKATAEEVKEVEATVAPDEEPAAEAPATEAAEAPKAE